MQRSGTAEGRAFADQRGLRVKADSYRKLYQAQLWRVYAMITEHSLYKALANLFEPLVLLHPGHELLDLLHNLLE